MRRSHLRAVFPLSFLASLAMGQGVIYVTDLQIFTSLAPCAASAISYHIMGQTRSNCPQAVTDLQGCVCTKNNNFGSIASAVSSSVSYSCGSTASDDQASAATVLTAYCNQNSLPSFPKPSIAVSQYITDVAEFQNLAPCAKSALSYAIQSMTYSYCPPEATALATCACQKNQNSLRISQVINSSVRYSCASHSADLTSAQAMFAAYCAMNSGTSAFPVPSPPPGDMSYFITALPQFSSLAPCAQSAVSYAVKSQTYDYCPDGPQALASCVCLKESMSGSLSSLITSGVKWSCTSTASEDITSALSVFDFYCSAAKSLVKPTGVAESIAQTYPAAKSGSVGQTSGPRASSSPGGSGGDSSGSRNGETGTTEEKKSPNVALIAGAAGGGAALLIGIGVAVFFLMRHARQKKAAAAESATAIAMQQQQPPDYSGKAELGGTELTGAAAAAAAAAGKIPPPSPSPSMMKLGASPRVDNVSPVSAHHNSAYAPPPMPGKAELQAVPPVPPSPYSELHGHGSGNPNGNGNGQSPQSQQSPYGQQPQQQSPYGHQQPQHQMYGQQQQHQPQQQFHHEMQGQQTYSAMARPELHGQQVHEFPGSGGGAPAVSVAAAGPLSPFQQYQQQQQQYQQHQQQNYYHEAESRPVTASSQQHLQPSSHAEMPGMSWHSGPLAGYSELEGGYARGGGGGGGVPPGMGR